MLTVAALALAVTMPLAPAPVTDPAPVKPTVGTHYIYAECGEDNIRGFDWAYTLGLPYKVPSPCYLEYFGVMDAAHQYVRFGGYQLRLTREQPIDVTPLVVKITRKGAVAIMGRTVVSTGDFTLIPTPKTSSVRPAK